MPAASDFGHLSVDGATENTGASRVTPALLCSTGETFDRALRSFREVLFERITHHEEEVFTARARFQLQRDEDRMHFENAHQKRRRAQVSARKEKRMRSKHRRSSRPSSKNVSPSREGLDDEDDDEEKRHFEEDQKKLYREHEEELQHQFPLAFLDDASASLMAFSLVPMIKNSMLSIARRRSEQYKEAFPDSSQTIVNGEVGNESKALQQQQPQQGDPINENAVKQQSQQGQQQQQEQEQHQQQQGQSGSSHVDGAAAKLSQCVTVVKDEEERQQPAAAWSIGRGAFIMPGHAGEKANTKENSQHPGAVAAKDACAGPAWASSIVTKGAAEFVRLAIESSAAREMEVLREDRKYVENVSLVSQHTQSMGLLAKIASEERRVADAKEEKMKVWRQAVQSIPQSTPLTYKVSPVKVKRKGYAFNISRDTHSIEPRRGPDEVEDNAMADHEHVEDSMTTRNFFFAQRRFRNDHLTGPTTPFRVGNWSEITLDDNDEMESHACEYLWPQHLEDRVGHVLCGVAVSGLKYWHPVQHSKGKEGQVQEVGNRDDHNGNDDQKMGGGRPNIVFLPRKAKKGWLSICGVGEFAASEVRLADK